MPRTLSTAEDRRAAIIDAAMPLVAARGLHGTPTLAVAKAAGISQAYLFRLFPTKLDLAVAVVEAGNERVFKAFAEAAARANHAGEDPISAMGQTYGELLEDRDLLLVQLHAHAASPDLPEVRAVMQRMFADLVALLKAQTVATDDEIRAFFATGMLCNVMAAISARDVDAPWAHVLDIKGRDGC